MRILTSLLLAVGALLSSVALSAHIANQTVLNPRRPGTVLAAVISSPKLNDQVVSTLETHYGPWPPKTRAAVEQAVNDPRLARAARHVHLNGRGQLNLAPVRAALAGELADTGHRRLARRLSHLGDPHADLVTMPAKINDPYQSLRRVSSWVARTGTLAAACCFALALLLPGDRARTARRIGIILLGVCGFVVVAYLAAVHLAAAASNVWLAAAAHTAAAVEHDIAAPLIPVAALGVTLIVASLLLPRLTPRTR